MATNEVTNNLSNSTSLQAVEVVAGVNRTETTILETSPNQESSYFKRVGNFIGRQKTKICLGATAVSVAATLALDPFEGTKEQVLEAAPYVVGGMAASEVAWLGGAAMMVGAIGSRVPLNPIKLKTKIPEISEKANNSKLFKAGFGVNIAGALGDFVVLSGAVVQNLPPHSWGILGFTLADLGVTLGVRKAMLGGIKKNAKNNGGDTNG